MIASLDDTNEGGSLTVLLTLLALEHAFIEANSLQKGFEQSITLFLIEVAWFAPIRQRSHNELEWVVQKLLISQVDVLKHTRWNFSAFGDYPLELTRTRNSGEVGNLPTLGGATLSHEWSVVLATAFWRFTAIFVRQSRQYSSPCPVRFSHRHGPKTVLLLPKCTFHPSCEE